jgi:hypothetical protein
VTAYSNVGVALAGHTLELASGRPYATLVDSAVFVPYGMTRSSVHQPMRGGLEDSRATPYVASGNEHVAVPRIYFNDAPASAAYATPHDMGLLMEQLLVPRNSADSAVAGTLFSRRFANHPALPGITLGFAETTDGPGVFEHGGDWQDYSNGMYLDRVNGIGLFAVFSSGEGGRVARELWKTLRDGYAGPTPAFVSPPAGRIVPECQQHFGTYRDTRMSRHSLARLGILTGDIRQMVVRINTGVAEVDKRVYREIGGGVVRSDDGRLVGFRCGKGREDTYAFRAEQPLTSYVRLTRFETKLAQRIYLAAALIGTILALIVDLRRGPRRRTLPDGTMARRDFVDVLARVLRIVAGVCILAVLCGLGYYLATTDPWSFQYGIPMRVAQLVRLFSYVCIGAAVALLVTLMSVVRSRASSGISQLLLAVPFATLAALLYQWVA